MRITSQRFIPYPHGLLRAQSPWVIPQAVPLLVVCAVSVLSAIRGFFSTPRTGSRRIQCPYPEVSPSTELRVHTAQEELLIAASPAAATSETTAESCRRSTDGPDTGLARPPAARDGDDAEIHPVLRAFLDDWESGAFTPQLPALTAEDRRDLKMHPVWGAPSLMRLEERQWYTVRRRLTIFYQDQCVPPTTAASWGG